MGSIDNFIDTVRTYRPTVNDLLPIASSLLKGHSISSKNFPDLYNRLPQISDADKLLRVQLKEAGITLDDLLLQLADLFSTGENAGRYSICLLHRHFPLRHGERMVAKGNVMEPTMDRSPRIVAERWNNEGVELEHKYIDGDENIPPPPSSDFWRRFRSIMDHRKITLLGICYTQKPKEGFVFLETTNHGGRKHVTRAVRSDDPRLTDEPTFSTTWVPPPPQDEDVISGAGATKVAAESACASHVCQSGTNHIYVLSGSVEDTDTGFVAIFPDPNNNRTIAFAATLFIPQPMSLDGNATMKFGEGYSSHTSFSGDLSEDGTGVGIEFEDGPTIADELGNHIQGSLIFDGTGSWTTYSA